jgi:membrane protein CcdC involved in cytochrome C biogenesis
MRKDQRLKHLAMLHDSLAELRKTRIDCMEEGASDAGRLGTHGWIMHYGAITPWHVVYVTARDERAAIKKATQQLAKEEKRKEVLS